MMYMCLSSIFLGREQHCLHSEDTVFYILYQPCTITQKIADWILATELILLYNLALVNPIVVKCYKFDTLYLVITDYISLE